jgi:small multidrug resistance pump
MYYSSDPRRGRHPGSWENLDVNVSYLYLALAILSEVIATSTLKSTAEFSRLLPSLIVVVGYASAFYFMTLSLRSIPIGISYAIWSGVGTVLIAAIAAIFRRQFLDIPALVGIGLIIGGVIVINLFSKSIGQ